MSGQFKVYSIKLARLVTSNVLLDIYVICLFCFVYRVMPVK